MRNIQRNKVQEQQHQWYLANQERKKREQRKWQRANYERVRRGVIKRRTDDPEEYKRYQREYHKRRYHSDPRIRYDFAVYRRVRMEVRRFFEDREFTNHERATLEKMVGWGPEEFIQRFESLFEEGMDWDNWTRNGWHIDHIKPKREFHYTSKEDEEFLKCWSLDNLRPMWSKRNLTGRPIIYED